MKREILLRLWNPYSKSYLHDVENVYQCLAQQNIFDGIQKSRTGLTPAFDHSADGFVWEQFIGVNGYTGDYEKRHENEVKLFEGDIVEAMSEGSKGTFVIKMRTESQPTFMLYPAWQKGKMWSIAASDLGREKGDYFDDLKVIGNIHSNPELLKQ